ncbi:MAG: TetR/AcrR family transcriptional regulator [Phycisphaerae bacterium]|jgi:TetR/AcrR family transcriptional repressor of nem operon|nr:TetR/AcrR family transcriptional regulator [Phycisphaerae bacterium]
MTPAQQSTRDKLIDAAMDLFAYQGYGPTGLSEIARKADVQQGSLYHFFPTKEELLSAVLERRKVLLWPEVLQPIWDSVDDPIERIFKLLDQYRQMLQMTEFSHGCPIGNLAIELTESHPNSRRLIAENFTNWLKAIEQCFHEASRRLPESADAKRLAIFVLTTMEGAVMLARTYRDFRAYDAAVASLREYIDALIEMETNWNASKTPSSVRSSSSKKRRA